MTTAFVLSGDGSLGSVEVGMLAALHEQHIEPDLLVGTSAGAPWNTPPATRAEGFEHERP